MKKFDDLFNEATRLTSRYGLDRSKKEHDHVKRLEQEINEANSIADKLDLLAKQNTHLARMYMFGLK